MKETVTIPKDQIENVRQVVKAELEEVKAIHFDKVKSLEPVTTQKVIMKENCFYVSALNIKNLFRKLGFVIKK